MLCAIHLFGVLAASDVDLLDILWNYTLVFVNLSSGQDALYVLMRLLEGAR